MDAKTFMKKWKEGILNITPLQQIQTQFNATLIMAVGFLVGLIVSLYNLKVFYWLALILLGGLINTSIQLLGLYQKRKALKEIEKIAEDVPGGEDYLELEQIPPLNTELQGGQK